MTLLAEKLAVCTVCYGSLVVTKQVPDPENPGEVITQETPCVCTTLGKPGYLIQGYIDITGAETKMNDIEDKINDIMDKCNDIFEKVSA